MEAVARRLPQGAVMRILRPLAVLVLAVALGTAPASALPARDTKPSVRGFLVRLESFLLLSWSKEGCRIDPWGRCVAEPTTESGCGIDPWGLCVNGEPTTESGCRIDPWGRCLPDQ
jgi:hypothetical protein